MTLRYIHKEIKKAAKKDEFTEAYLKKPYKSHKPLLGSSPIIYFNINLVQHIVYLLMKIKGLRRKESKLVFQRCSLET